MFYQKAAVMGTLVLKPCSQCLSTIAYPIQAKCGQSHVLHGFLLVKFWNCQSYITCVLKKWGNSNFYNIHPGYKILLSIIQVSHILHLLQVHTIHLKFLPLVLLQKYAKTRSQLWHHASVLHQQEL